MPALFRRLGTVCATAAACLALLGGCVTTTQGSVAGGSRSQFMMVSEQQVLQSSQQAFSQQNSQARAQGALITSGPQYTRVVRIMRRMVPQVAHFRPDAARWPWQLVLIRSNELNAHVMPGGKVTFYTGIIDRLQLTDDEIAAIMWHEMAHALREHVREQMSQQAAGNLALKLGGALLGASDSSMQMAGMAKQMMLDLPFSRSMESEADTYGLELAARAGYNPTAALTLWDKMRAAGAGTGSSFLSTHPSSAERMASMRAQIPRLMPIYEAARQRP